MKKQQNLKKSLKLHKETVRQLTRTDLEPVVGGGLSDYTCFPDICLEWDSSGC